MITHQTSVVDRFVSAIGSRLDGSPLAVLLDIDGTLAPIAPTPDAAIVPPETRDAVRRLVHLPGVHVVMVSGRSVADALRMIRVEGAWIVGNHGLEFRAASGEISAIDEARAYEDAIAAASSALAPLARSAPGALVENKRWTLSLHYRSVDDAEAPALIAHARDVARQLGLRVTEGKKIIELRPPIDVNKGTASIALAERVGALGPAGSILYAGDDQTDEDAFRLLRARAPRAVTARIMDDAADTRAAAETKAEFVLASPSELRRILEWLVTRRTR